MRGPSVLRADAPPCRHRSVVVAVLLAVVTALAGCAAIPTDGPIGTGEVVVRQPGAPVPLAIEPEPDATPEQIIGGFLRAVDAGIFDEFATARQFLTFQASAGWDPRARAVVYQGGGPDIVRQDEDTVLVTVPVAATIDGGGRLAEAPPSTREEVAFELTQGAEGQWRISALEDGVLLSSPTFEQFYRRTPVYFATTDLEYLVPDVRWFPTRNQATAAVEALLAGPSPWLRDAVVTGVPDGARLSTTAVTVERGTALVDLSVEARLASAPERALLQAQLDATLMRQQGVLVNDVQMLIAGVPVDPPAVPDLAVDPPPGAGPYVLVDGVLGLLERGTLVPAEGVAPLPPEANSPAVQSGDGLVVVRLGSSQVAAVPSDGTAPVPLLTGTSLVAPSVDRFGWAWTAERSSAGLLRAARADGTTVDVELPWLAGRTVVALDVAADGARVAITSTGAEGAAVDVAGIARMEDGTPRQSGEPLPLAPALVEVGAVAWVDEVTLGVLGRTTSQAAATVHLLEVGGRTSALPLVDDAVGLAAGRGERGLYVLSADGALHARQGQSWAVVAEGIDGVTFPG
ncbi:LpqB family beta-propeller domain-containing protein [Actinotalea sp. Marseille-Q4924]|uniref:LpqB family beta-propeller domain-containing protein n=1 Tax=Actinotalea sp. Marseille-Q4924 TaxID=2866571 RepID=UPI001CE3F86D|nr:LpqB family beta-propeller domain-containing protein [Actinotalea sp. Marseille-Q4924]